MRIRNGELEPATLHGTHDIVHTLYIITHTHSRSLNSCNTSHTRISCGFYKSYLLHHMRATISCRFSFIVIAFIRFLTLMWINVFLKLCSINQIVRGAAVNCCCYTAYTSSILGCNLSVVIIFVMYKIIIIIICPDDIVIDVTCSVSIGII